MRWWYFPKAGTDIGNFTCTTDTDLYVKNHQYKVSFITAVANNSENFWKTKPLTWVHLFSG